MMGAHYDLITLAWDYWIIFASSRVTSQAKIGPFKATCAFLPGDDMGKSESTRDSSLIVRQR